MRKHWLDNLRGTVVLLVVLYHIFYEYNSLGIIRNVDIPGVPAFDTVMYILYPWFMVCLFLCAGISAKAALLKSDRKSFLRSRTKKLLVPGIAGIFILGWVNGWVTSQYVDMFGTAGQQIPGFVKYLIWCASGTGALWFIQELYLATLLLLLITKIDRNAKLAALAEKVTLPILLLLCIPAWLSSYILNTPLIEVYRNGIYIFYFLLGYYVFSLESIQNMLKKYAPYFIAAGFVCGVCYTVYFYGENYTLMDNLKSPLCNLYAYFGTLAALSLAMRYCDSESTYTRLMRRNNFAVYALHLPLIIILAYASDRLLGVRGVPMYLVLTAAEAVCLPLFIFIVRRIPIINRLLIAEG